MFAGYEYEDTLLAQWADWNKQEGRHAGGYTTNWSIIDRTPCNSGCRISDDVAMDVNSALGKLQIEDSRLLKRYYLHESDEREEFVLSALKQFARAYSSLKVRYA